MYLSTRCSISEPSRVPASIISLEYHTQRRLIESVMHLTVLGWDDVCPHVRWAAGKLPLIYPFIHSACPSFGLSVFLRLKSMLNILYRLGSSAASHLRPFMFQHCPMFNWSRRRRILRPLRYRKIFHLEEIHFGCGKISQSNIFHLARELQ